MKVLLNNVPVEAPIGLDGLTLKKSRHPRYWGYLYRRLGFVPGLGEITFSDPYAVRTLRDAFDKGSLTSETSFSLVDEKGRALYNAFVDYATFGFRPGEASCSFRDDNSVTGLESALATQFSIPAYQSISLPGQPLTSEATYILNDVNVVSRVASGSFLHSLPVHRADDKNQAVPGELTSISQPLALGGIYRNDTTQKVTLRLSGIVDVTVEVSGGMTASLGYQLKNGNTTVSTTPLASYALYTDPEDIIALLDTVVTVPVGHSLVVGWIEADFGVTSMTVTYNPNTGIALGQPVTWPETDCYGLYAYNLFTELLAKSAGSFSLQSDFFRSGAGKGVFITNGANLRGISKPLKASISDLFDGLSGIFNLMLSLKGGVLSVEPKADLLAKGGITILTSISDVRYDVNTNYLASEIMAGYTTWKGDSLTSAAETNGSRMYRTSLTTLRNPLDLRSNLIAAGTLIEETRQKQFYPETAGSQKAEEHDDDLFVVMVNPHGRALATPFYNADIDPAMCLANWMTLLTHCKALRLESFEGAITSTEPIGLDLTGIEPLIGNLTAVVTTRMSMPDYEALNDFIQFFDGEKTRTGLLLDAEWNNTASGTIATLTIAC